MEIEKEKEREPVPVPVRRKGRTIEKEITEKTPEHQDAEMPRMPRRWYVY